MAGGVKSTVKGESMVERARRALRREGRATAATLAKQLGVQAKCVSAALNELIAMGAARDVSDASAAANGRHAGRVYEFARRSSDA